MKIKGLFFILLIFIAGCVQAGPTMSEKEMICNEAAEQSELCHQCVPYDITTQETESLDVEAVCLCDCLDEEGNKVSVQVLVPSEVFE